jgi:hypothetical protein
MTPATMETIRPSVPANVLMKLEGLMHEVYCLNATLHLPPGSIRRDDERHAAGISGRRPGIDVENLAPGETRRRFYSDVDVDFLIRRQ